MTGSQSYNAGWEMNSEHQPNAGIFWLVASKFVNSISHLAGVLVVYGRSIVFRFG